MHVFFPEVDVKRLSASWVCITTVGRAKNESLAEKQTAPKPSLIMFVTKTSSSPAMCCNMFGMAAALSDPVIPGQDTMQAIFERRVLFLMYHLLIWVSVFPSRGLGENR